VPDPALRRHDEGFFCIDDCTLAFVADRLQPLLLVLIELRDGYRLCLRVIRTANDLRDWIAMGLPAVRVSVSAEAIRSGTDLNAHQLLGARPPSPDPRLSL
jgi:hypothetical protein